MAVRGRDALKTVHDGCDATMTVDDACAMTVEEHVLDGAPPLEHFARGEAPPRRAVSANRARPLADLAAETGCATS